MCLLGPLQASGVCCLGWGLWSTLGSQMLSVLDRCASLLRLRETRASARVSCAAAGAADQPKSDPCLPSHHRGLLKHVRRPQIKDSDVTAVRQEPDATTHSTPACLTIPKQRYDTNVWQDCCVFLTFGGLAGCYLS